MTRLLTTINSFAKTVNRSINLNLTQLSLNLQKESFQFVNSHSSISNQSKLLIKNILSKLSRSQFIVKLITYLQNILQTREDNSRKFQKKVKVFTSMKLSCNANVSTNNQDKAKMN